MTRERAAYLLPFVKAFAEGKTIQWRNDPKYEWRDCPAFCVSEHSYDEYRIKPEPKVVWIRLYEDDSMSVFHNYVEASFSKANVKFKLYSCTLNDYVVVSPSQP